MLNNQETSLPCSNFVTRKLICGPDGSFIERLKKDFGVSISAKTSATPVIIVKGAKSNTAAVKKVVEILQLLDQKASVLENQHNIQNSKGVTKEHWGYLRVDFDALLENKSSPETRTPPSMSAAYHAAATMVKVTEEQKADEPHTYSLKEVKAKARKRQSIEFLGPFVPMNLRQAIVYTACLETTLGDDGAKRLTNSYVYAAGPFGGGKTYTPIRAGFELYTQGLVDEIIMIRPSTTSTRRDPGAMPGNPRQKIDPYIKGGVGSNISKIVKTPIDQLEKQRVIRFLTPEFERGESYDHALVIVDETQNLTIEQAELLIGRLGQGSIMVFTGDIGGNQNDINNQMPGLAHLIATQGQGTFKDPVLARHTAFVEFLPEDSAARNGILPHVAQALRNPPEDYSGFMAVINQERRDSKLSQAIDKARQYGEQTLTQCANETFKRYEPVLRTDFPQFFPAEDTKVVQLGKRTAPAAIRA